MEEVLNHTCGVCEQTFPTEADYVAHTCTTGFTPADPEHLGPEFKQISEDALARGAARQAEEAQQVQAPDLPIA